MNGILAELENLTTKDLIYHVLDYCFTKTSCSFRLRCHSLMFLLLLCLRYRSALRKIRFEYLVDLINRKKEEIRRKPLKHCENLITDTRANSISARDVTI